MDVVSCSLSSINKIIQTHRECTVALILYAIKHLRGKASQFILKAGIGSWLNTEAAQDYVWYTNHCANSNNSNASMLFVVWFHGQLCQRELAGNLVLPVSSYLHIIGV